MATLERIRTLLVPRWRRWRRHVIGGVLLLALGGGLWASRAPYFRVINPHAAPVLLFIDGKLRATLPPTSLETPGAGLELRLSPGPHNLLVRTQEGVLLEELSPHLAPNSRYLFVPGESDQCFWVEHTAYGQALPERPALRLLPSEQHLWTLPDEIDAWFFPTPPPSSDRRSSGGTRTAIRQARCGFEPWK